MTASERQTTSLIVIGIVLLPLQIWPAMPLPGMQLSDIVFAIAFAQFLIARREIPPAAVSIPIAAFAVILTMIYALRGPLRSGALA